MVVIKILGELFSNNVTALVLDFLIINSNKSYSKYEIAESLGISVRSVSTVIYKLLKKDIIIMTENRKFTKYYKYNMDNKIALLLGKFVYEISKKS